MDPIFFNPRLFFNFLEEAEIPGISRVITIVSSLSPTGLTLLTAATAGVVFAHQQIMYEVRDAAFNQESLLTKIESHATVLTLLLVPATGIAIAAGAPAADALLIATTMVVIATVTEFFRQAAGLFPTPPAERPLPPPAPPAQPPVLPAQPVAVPASQVERTPSGLIKPDLPESVRSDPALKQTLQTNLERLKASLPIFQITDESKTADVWINKDTGLIVGFWDQHRMSDPVCFDGQQKLNLTFGLVAAKTTVYFAKKEGAKSIPYFTIDRINTPQPGWNINYQSLNPSARQAFDVLKEFVGNTIPQAADMNGFDCPHPTAKPSVRAVRSYLANANWEFFDI